MVREVLTDPIAASGMKKKLSEAHPCMLLPQQSTRRVSPILQPMCVFLLPIISGCLIFRLSGFENLCAHINLYVASMCTHTGTPGASAFHHFHHPLLSSLSGCLLLPLAVPCLKLNHKPILTGDVFYCGLLGGVLQRNWSSR